MVNVLRVISLSFLCLTVLAAPLAADAQQAGKVYRVGYIANADPAATPGGSATSV